MRVKIVIETEDGARVILERSVESVAELIAMLLGEKRSEAHRHEPASLPPPPPEPRELPKREMPPDLRVEVSKEGDRAVIRIRKSSRALMFSLTHSDLLCIFKNKDLDTCVESIASRLASERGLAPSSKLTYKSMIRQALAVEDVRKRLYKVYQDLYWESIERTKRVLERDRRLHLEAMREK